MRQKIKILFLAANPNDRTRLELKREFSAIQDALLRGKYRDDFQLLGPQLTTRMKNFSSALTTQQPHIVHFCGHGSANQGIVFEGEDGYSRLAGKQELTTLFEKLTRNARLVFLNACHTKEQAEMLGRTFDYTIGTNGRIMDKDAGDFAGAFYRLLFDGATVEGAFLSAQSAVDNRVNEISVLSKREGANDSIPFVRQVLGHARLPKKSGGFNITINDNGKVGNIIPVTGRHARVEINQEPHKSRRKR